MKAVIRKCLLFALISLMSFSTSVSAQVDIVTSIKPLTLLVKQLVAPEDKVQQLLKADRSPHHYQLTVADRQQLAQADLVVWIGPDLESFLEKPLAQRQGALLTATDLREINWPEARAEQGEDNHHHHHDHDRDPHLWLDPYNLGVVAQALTKALIQQSPENAAVYQKNSDRLLKELAALDSKLQMQLPTISKVPFIVMHPAYSHFVERYSLNQQDYIVITPERGIGAKHLYELKKLQVKCVFGEEGSNNKLASKVANYSKAKITLLDPLGANLADDALATSIIDQLAKTVLDCLSSS